MLPKKSVPLSSAGAERISRPVAKDHWDFPVAAFRAKRIPSQGLQRQEACRHGAGDGEKTGEVSFSGECSWNCTGEMINDKSCPPLENYGGEHCSHVHCPEHGSSFPRR